MLTHANIHISRRKYVTSGKVFEYAATGLPIADALVATAKAALTRTPVDVERRGQATGRAALRIRVRCREVGSTRFGVFGVFGVDVASQERHRAGSGQRQFCRPSRPPPSLRAHGEAASGSDATLQSADVAVATDLSATRTAWLAVHRGWVGDGIYDHRSASVGISWQLPSA